MASNYFASDKSKSTNTVVYFDWKMVIYIYVCGKCRTQFMLPMEKSVTFTGACANKIILSINRSFVYKAKEGRYVRIIVNRRS
jgi:DNA-directed RNA polymerase subunit RPC12/RpoP